MRSELFPLASSPLTRFPSPRPISGKATSFDILHPRSQYLQETRRSARQIVTREPPWTIPPPVAPQNPFSSEARLLESQLMASGTEIPFSVRFIQMRKKRLARKRPSSPEADLGSAGNAVWSLACMVEELNRLVLPANREAIDTARRETEDSLIWLFQRVFYTSPNLFSELLVLTSQFVIQSTQQAISKSLMGAYRCWADIGILEETKKKSDYKRRQLAYELMIIAEKPNSMILLNYAQLLYQYEKDLDRAEEYFKLAVRAEPVDGEARIRYAAFLWEARGDVDGAEAMFIDAMEVDPCNQHYRHVYAMFILMNGGWDICYPLDGPSSQLSEL